MRAGEGPTIGAAIQARREALGLSRTALALRAGLWPHVVGKIESGATRRPRPATLRRLAEALELSVGALEQRRTLGWNGGDE